MIAVSEPVLGVQIDDGLVTAAGEEMTLEAVHERYPAGEIIHLVIVNHGPAVPKLHPPKETSG